MSLMLWRRASMAAAHPGRDYGASVMPGKGFEVRIDHSFVAVAARDSRLQVVWHNGARGTPRRNGWRSRMPLSDPPFSGTTLPRSMCSGCTEVWRRTPRPSALRQSPLVDYLQSVSGEIHIHLVTGAVLHMAYGVGLEHELPELHSEGRTKVSVGIVRVILFVQLFDCHALPGKPCRIFRQQGFEPDLTFRCCVPVLLAWRTVPAAAHRSATAAFQRVCRCPDTFSHSAAPCFSRCQKHC